VDEQSSYQLGFIVGRIYAVLLTTNDSPMRKPNRKKNISRRLPPKTRSCSPHVIDVHLESLAFIASAEAGHAFASDVHCRGTFAMFGEPESWFLKCGLRKIVGAMESLFTRAFRYKIGRRISSVSVCRTEDQQGKICNGFGLRLEYSGRRLWPHICGLKEVGMGPVH
jgi:hypothetical protein